MVPAVIYGFVLVLWASSACADLRLVPAAEQYELDGVKLDHLVFSDGGQRITYTPPRGWQYSVRGDQFLLHPSNQSGAEAIISLTKLARPEVFDDAATKQLSEAVITSLPSAARHVSIVLQQKNPLLIESKETFLVVIHYDCNGLEYARSVMFLNRKNEQLRFQLTCLRWNFSQAQTEFFQSHFSWQNL